MSKNKPQTTRYFLNAVDPAIQSIGNVTPGTWTKDDGKASGFLQRYAQSIRVDSAIGDLGQIQSVPSVFARPMLFAQALGSKAASLSGETLDVSGPVHRAVREEWRGLIATFALADYFGYQIRVVPYIVSAIEDIPSKYQGVGGEDDNYLRIMLRSQLPKPEKAWETIGLIYCDDVLIGGTSPWTVVYTPAEYNCPISIPWSREVKRKGLGDVERRYRVFSDPVEYFKSKSSKRELRILDLWLKELLSAHANSKWEFKALLEKDELADLWTGNIKREVDAWRRDIPSEPLNGREERFTIQIGTPFYNSAPFKYFVRGCTLDPDGELLANSDILLADRSGREVIAFSRARGADASLRVYGPVFGDQIKVGELRTSEVEGPWRTDLGHEVPVGYVIAEDVFFPPRLAELPLSEKAIQCGSKRFALPLTSTFLKYFEARDLKPGGKVSLKLKEVGKNLIARLELPLRNNQSITVEKTYELENADDVMPLPQDRDFVPAMAVWPDFQDPSWRSYIAFFVGPANVDKAMPLVVQPIGADGSLREATSLDGSQKQGRLWEWEKPIIGFLLRENSKAKTELGLVLVNHKSLSEVDISSKWQISLDFGTSNTAIAEITRNQHMQLAKIEGRACILTSGSGDSFEERIKRDFYPEENIVQPFITALKDQTSENTFLEGRLTYQMITRFEPNQVSMLVPNVKWGVEGGQTDTGPMKAFLSHVVRLILAQARANGMHNVHLTWSYPLALPESVKGEMRSYWTTLHQAFCDPQVVSLTVEHEGVSESDAVCRQLRGRHNENDAKILASSLSIMIDVGGGSTDVGIWSGGGLLDQISAKLAGNDIVDKALLGRPSFGDAMAQVTGTHFFSQQLNSNLPMTFNAVMNSGEWAANPYDHPVAMAARYDMRKEPWSSLRTQIYLYFTGITYFIGLAVRRFMWNDGDARNVDIYYGGRASSLLAWLGNRRDVQDALVGIFRAGASIPKTAILGDKIEAKGYIFDEKSFLPVKHEVAIGCLYPPLDESDRLTAAKSKAINGVATGMPSGPTGAQDREAPRRVILGEEQCKDANGDSLEFFTEVTALQMKGVTLPLKDAMSSTMIIAFLEGAMKRYGNVLNVDLEGLAKIKIQKDTIEDGIRRVTGNGEILQPVFISELASVMKSYAKRGGEAG